MKWSVASAEAIGERGVQFAIAADSRPATVSDVIAAWTKDAEFRSWFNALLAESPYSAFRWETPAVTSQSLGQAFHFVLLDSPGLDRRPDREAFASHFSIARNGVAVFPNLGRDAILVVPCPVADPPAYGHLAAFVRQAPEIQRHALWQAIGEAMTSRVGTKPVWLSTAGAGVSWLHVRLDDQPKYYGFAPYRNRSPQASE